MRRNVTIIESLAVICKQHKLFSMLMKRMLLLPKSDSVSHYLYSTHKHTLRLRKKAGRIVSQRKPNKTQDFIYGKPNPFSYLKFIMKSINCSALGFALSVG